MTITITLTKEQVAQVMSQLLPQYQWFAPPAPVATPPAPGNETRPYAEVLREELAQKPAGTILGFRTLHELLSAKFGFGIPQSSLSSALYMLRQDGILQVIRRGTYCKL